MWDGQLSPSFKSIRLEAFGGWKVDRGSTQLHARILRGKGVQKKNWNRITVRSSTSATFVLPVRHGTGVALYTKRIGVFQNPQSTGSTLAREDKHVVWSSDEDEANGEVSISLGTSH